MRSYEFAMKCNRELYLGERPTPLLFKKLGDQFTPAVLCLEAEPLPEERRSGDASRETVWEVRAVPGLLYWDPAQGVVVREQISFARQKELGVPFSISFPVQEESEAMARERQKQYYVTAEKVCCALEAGCLTREMAAGYRAYVQPLPSGGLLLAYRQFFPEAAEKLFGI